MYVIIVANAPHVDLVPFHAALHAADVLIAADGGAIALHEAGVQPHLLIGDLDSVGATQFAALRAMQTEIRRYPREKDETDLELAYLAAAEYGATRIDVIGALGGRWDHSLANITMLAMPELRDRHVRLLEPRQTLTLVTTTLELHGVVGDTVSLLPLTPEVRGVTTRGLLYPLDDATLRFERARGVSNVLLESPASVSLSEGLLIVVHHDDGGSYQWRTTPVRS